MADDEQERPDEQQRPSDDLLRREEREEERPRASVQQVRDFIVRKHRELFEPTLELAEAGDVEAQLKLADLYAHNHGVIRADPSKADFWLFRATLSKATSGDPSAMRKVGTYFRTGMGTAIDPDQSRAWHHRAMTFMSPDELLSLGDELRGPDYSRPSPEDLAMAIRCYERVEETWPTWLEAQKQSGNDDAELGKYQGESPYVEAMRRLFEIYGDRQLHLYDPNLAVDFLTKAAAEGHIKSMWTLGDEYASGSAVPPNPGLAEDWYARAAQSGTSWEKHKLGQMYLRGESIRKDLGEAVRWLQAAADAGLCDAQYELGKLLEEGAGVERNPALAAEWYQKAADQDSDDAACTAALVRLGRMYEDGIGVSQDYDAALYYYHSAADTYVDPSPYDWDDPLPNRRDPEAQYRLGLMYFHGRGVEKDDGAAAQWFRRAATPWPFGGRHPQAAYWLGTMYRRGLGVERDPLEAYKWLFDAADALHLDAAEELHSLYEEETERLRGFDWQTAKLFSALAEAYRNGDHGLSRDDALAVIWSERAASRGLGDASAAHPASA